MSPDTASENIVRWVLSHRTNYDHIFREGLLELAQILVEVDRATKLRDDDSIASVRP